MGSLMKKILFTVAFLILSVTTTTAMAHDDYYYKLVIYNNWEGHLIRVKEGWIIKSEQTISYGEKVDWHMITSTTSHLHVEYIDATGSYQQIQGCPSGDNSLHDDMIAHVVATPNNPNIPMCQ